ncbi:hypothetical protein Q5424_14380 [Conexibacter sp. JD483]|uniref:hypothetical protein n=1 Tax=unclassified Conexibacter TaxID=2627773 RepID=UPI00271BEC30|nr:MULTISPECIES: hypothetical protein [unclassified Conexibacter]MDO8186298.1 hypothetical protein [Conexibacter sp. CPCC 205706]MDO8197503.1 hypothetical protein [Conexibacter sp. CPCC 205762]MDR9370286.1 hypothetical protein [Conexibacter sp. JD483]
MNVTVRTIRRLLAIALAGALAATAIALLLGSSASSAAPAEEAGAASNPWAPVQTPAELHAAFAADVALLRQPADDSIPATLPLAKPEVDLSQARQLTPPSARALARAGAGATGDEVPEQPDTTVWVVPNQDGSQCLLVYQATDQSLGYNCAYPSDAVSARMVMTVSRTGQDAEIYGVVPDGVDSVTVELADGSTVDLPVTDNGYMAQFDQPTASISFVDGNGDEQTARITSGA